MRLLLFAALAASSPAAAASFDFLARDADARAVGLGGAYSALASDASALYYNPAGLGMVGRSEAAVMSARGVGEQIHNDLALALRAGLGLSLRQYSFGDVPVTTLAAPDGTGAKAGVNGWSGAAGYGVRLSTALAAGAAIRFADHAVASESARAAALDLGLMLRPSSVAGLSLAASASNASADDRLPAVQRLGAAYERGLGTQIARVAVELTRGRGSDPGGAAGVELEWAGLLRARAGWDSAQDAGNALAFGFGVTVLDVCVDYAAAARGPLGYEHWLSARARFGPRRD